MVEIVGAPEDPCSLRNENVLCTLSSSASVLSPKLMPCAQVMTEEMSSTDTRVADMPLVMIIELDSSPDALFFMDSLCCSFGCTNDHARCLRTFLEVRTTSAPSSIANHISWRGLPSRAMGEATLQSSPFVLRPPITHLRQRMSGQG